MDIQRIVPGIKQRIIKNIWNKKKNNIFILMLHEVTDGQRAYLPDLSIEISNLKLLISKIKDIGAVICGIDDIMDDQISIPDSCPRVVITFDDIFHNAVVNALPYLKDSGIPYTVFITPDYIGQELYLTKAQMTKLASEPLCTIGYHTKSHSGLRFLNHESDVKDAIVPLAFEEEYGIRCKYFAYPYGSLYMCPARIIRFVSEAGFCAAFGTVNSGTNRDMINQYKYYIPRLCVSDDHFNEIINRIKMQFSMD